MKNCFDRGNQLGASLDGARGASYLLTIFFYLAMIFSLVGCSSTSTWPKSIPKADIMFQIAMNYRPYNLGFIQGDGSNLQKVNMDENFVKPIWSFDGTVLYGLSSPVGQTPYEDVGYPAFWDIKNGKFKRCDENLFTFDQIEGYKT